MPPSSLEVIAIDAPRTVADARRWLRGEFERWGPTPAIRQAAELVLSELVTNAVLHSPGPMRVSVSRRDDGLAIEVVDANTHGVPALQQRYSSEATTGRGLQIVDRCCAAWGVRGLKGGKGVWALLSDHEEPRSGERHAKGFKPATWLLEDPTAPLAEPRPGRSGEVELATIRVAGLPLWVYLAAQEHNDALMREFRLLSVDADSVPTRLVALAAETRQRFAAEGTQVRSQVERAIERGQSTIDLELAVPRVGWELLGHLCQLLDEADEYCERGELLTLASPPIVRRFRAWYLDQVSAQLEGSGPGAWPGPVEPPGRGSLEGGTKERR